MSVGHEQGVIRSLAGGSDELGFGPCRAVVMRDHDLDISLLAVELLPGKPDIIPDGHHVWSRGTAVLAAKWHRRRKGAASIERPRIEHALANGASGEPGHVIGSVGSNRQARTVVGAGVDPPIVVADPM